MEHSTQISYISSQVLSAGSLSSVLESLPLCKLGHTWDSPFLIFPRDCAAPSLLRLHIQLQSCTELFLLPSQNKNREQKEKNPSTDGFLLNPTFILTTAFISVSLESLSMCLHPPNYPFFISRISRGLLRKVKVFT